MDYFEQSGSYMIRDGLAKQRGMKSLCRKKLCMVSTDKEFLANLLYEMSQANDCYSVKYSADDRLGIYLGQCYLTNDSAIGDAWARYESHPKVWAMIQDDEFCESFRSRIRTYKGP